VSASRLDAVLETLDAAAVRRWCAGGLELLRRHQREIDALNVYPVPDGDTGTNLVLTMTSAQQALSAGLPGVDTDPSPHGQALRLMARGALLGARGNSGVIVSQILRGLADALAGTESVRGRALADGLRAAAAAAYAAVATPVEGTVLTVAAAAAHAAHEADSDDLPTVVRAAAAAGAEALAHTPEQLPALANAGVVDAGGRGLCVLFDALLAVVASEAWPLCTLVTTGTAAAPAVPGTSAAPAVPGTAAAPAVPGTAAAPAVPGTAAAPAALAAEPPSYAYEVQFLLDADEPAVRALRQRLAGLGDSLAIVGTGLADGARPTWNVHVHVDDIGGAIEAAVTAGRPYQISVTRFADQMAPTTDVSAPGGPPAGVASGSAGDAAAQFDPDGRAAVVVAAGDGLATLLAAEGATVVGARPSIGDMLDAIRSTGAGRVVMLPNDPDTQAVARAAAQEAAAHGARVSVVPTRSPVQALAALAVRDPGRAFDDDVIAMAEAAGACRYAEVCYAGREAITIAGPCRPGDLLALVEGEVHLIGINLVEICQTLLDRLLGGGGELVTLLLGADAPANLADELTAHLAQQWPFVEVNSYRGGQPHYPLLVGVE
jgi:uncharacterized protein